jgi:hypothetical protein
VLLADHITFSVLKDADREVPLGCVRLNACPISCERSSSPLLRPMTTCAPKFDQPLVVAPFTVSTQ